KTVLLEDIRKNVNFEIIADSAGTAFRHRVTDFRKETCERVFLPVREECVALDSRSPLGSDERDVVTPGATEIEIRFAPRGLLGCEHPVPDSFAGVARLLAG